MHKLSALPQYGNLSEYNYEKMKLILDNWQHRYNGNDTYFDAEWNNESTRIKIRYHTNTGAFMHIIEEERMENKLLSERSKNLLRQVNLSQNILGLW